MDYSTRSAQTFIGLDVHKKDIVAAMELPSGGFVERKFANTGVGVTRLVRWMEKHAEGGFECCYEAGFCGFDLSRKLTGLGVVCRVIAPSLTPVKPGERVKTDRRDARKLAGFLRAGLLTEVSPPTEEEEALRGLCRCREDVRKALHAARQQLIKFLDQRGYFYHGGAHWTTRHWEWLRGITFENSTAHLTYRTYVYQVEAQEGALRQIDESLKEVAHSEPYREMVERLCCFRGIAWLTAIMLVAELYDLGRFSSPRALMAYLGLTPSEHSSGEKENRGGITRAGNSLARRLLVEAAWHYRRGPRKGKALQERQVGQPAWVIARADAAEVRLSSRLWRLVHRGKSSAVAVVAVARELVGFIWSVMRPEPCMA
jgi:transposase